MTEPLTCSLCGDAIAAEGPHDAWEWWPDPGPGPVMQHAHPGCYRLHDLLGLDEWTVGELGDYLLDWLGDDGHRWAEARAEAAGCPAAEALMQAAVRAIANGDEL